MRMDKKRFNMYLKYEVIVLEKVMKKIYNAMLITCFALYFLFCGNSASACSQKGVNGQITGGACSIEELNNLENAKIQKGRMNFLSKQERDLRPYRPFIESQKSADCIFGNCLYKTILKDEDGK